MYLAHLFELDGIELALCRAQAAADAQVFVNLGGTAAETACRLLAHLLLGESDTLVGERLCFCGVVAVHLTLFTVKAADAD